MVVTEVDHYVQIITNKRVSFFMFFILLLLLLLLLLL